MQPLCPPKSGCKSWKKVLRTACNIRSKVQSRFLQGTAVFTYNLRLVTCVVICGLFVPLLLGAITSPFTPVFCSVKNIFAKSPSKNKINEKNETILEKQQNNCAACFRYFQIMTACLFENECWGWTVAGKISFSLEYTTPAAVDYCCCDISYDFREAAADSSTKVCVSSCFFVSHLARHDSILDLLPLTPVDRLEHIHAASEEIHRRGHPRRLLLHTTPAVAPSTYWYSSSRSTAYLQYVRTVGPRAIYTYIPVQEEGPTDRPTHRTNRAALFCIPPSLSFNVGLPVTTGARNAWRWASRYAPWLVDCPFV